MPINDVKLSFPVHDREKNETFRVKSFSDIALTSKTTSSDILSRDAHCILCELDLPFTTLHGGKSFVAQKNQLLAELTAGRDDLRPRCVGHVDGPDCHATTPVPRLKTRVTMCRSSRRWWRPRSSC